MIETHVHPERGFLKNHKGIIYAESTKEANRLCQVLSTLRNVPCFKIYSDNIRNKSDLEDFINVDSGIAINMLVEGFDDAKINYSILLKEPIETERNERDRIQRDGRLIRKMEGKPDKIGLSIISESYDLLESEKHVFSNDRAIPIYEPCAQSI